MMVHAKSLIDNNAEELRKKLHKWKDSAETDKPVFSNGDTADSKGGVELPEKPLRFQHAQLKKLLEGKLNPPENKKWTRKGVQALLDNLDVRLKFEERSRSKTPLEELYKCYDVPMALVCIQNENED